MGINWGVRLETENDLHQFLHSLCVELGNRSEGKSISKLSLKIMIAKDSSVEPKKFLGHGNCTEHSKSTSFNMKKELFDSVIDLF